MPLLLRWTHNVCFIVACSVFRLALSKVHAPTGARAHTCIIGWSTAIRLIKLVLVLTVSTNSPSSQAVKICNDYSLFATIWVGCAIGTTIMTQIDFGHTFQLTRLSDFNWQVFLGCFQRSKCVPIKLVYRLCF